MKYRVTHTTAFRYEAPVGLCYNLARLQPRNRPGQQVLSSELRISPLPFDHYRGTDCFGNPTDWFSIQQPHQELIVTAVSDIIATGHNGAAGDVTTPWEEVRDQLRLDPNPELIEVRQYLLDSPMIGVDEMLTEYAAPSFPAGRPLHEAVHDLMERIYREFKYDPEFSTIATPLREVMEHRSGVCQDFAHLAIGCLRALGLAARYVSGYIETDPPPGKEKLVGADASHAWFATFLPGIGWLDYDPTNNQLPADRHITVAWGRDFSDVTPLKGVAYGGGHHELEVAVDVRRLPEEKAAPPV